MIKNELVMLYSVLQLWRSWEGSSLWVKLLSIDMCIKLPRANLTRLTNKINETSNFVATHDRNMYFRQYETKPVSEPSKGVGQQVCWTDWVVNHSYYTKTQSLSEFECFTLYVASELYITSYLLQHVQ